MSARYVWGTPDHFPRHDARGRERRLAHETATLRAANTEAAARERDRAWREQAREACAPPPELLRMWRDPVRPRGPRQTRAVADPRRCREAALGQAGASGAFR